VSRHQPGDVVHTSARGAVVRYSPTQGASWRYVTACPHGKSVRARTLADAREDARDPGEWCTECKPRPHGTLAAYRRHLRAGETPCVECKAAKAAESRAERSARGAKVGQVGRPATAPCGTPAAYKRHLRHGETPCAACKAANAARWQRRRAAKAAAR